MEGAVIDQQQQQPPTTSLANLALEPPAPAASSSHAATPSPAQAEPSTELQPSMRQRCFSEVTSEATLHFQVLDLGRQLYVWASAGSAGMANLHLSIKTHMDPVPSCSSLLPSTATSSGSSIAQRLALKVNRPVLCSWNIPPNSQLLEVVAERRLLQELKDMKLVAEAPT